MAYNPNVISMCEQNSIQAIYEDSQLAAIAKMSRHRSENLGYEEQITPRKHQGERGHKWLQASSLRK
jgi:hypothetical protein